MKVQHLCNIVSLCSLNFIIPLSHSMDSQSLLILSAAMQFLTLLTLTARRRLGGPARFLIMLFNSQWILAGIALAIKHDELPENLLNWAIILASFIVIISEIYVYWTFIIKSRDILN